MSKRTATLLVGVGIALIVYVGITVAALVRDLDSMNTPELWSAGPIAQAPTAPARPQTLQLNENRAEPGVPVLRPARKRRIRSVGHHSRRMKQEPTTLFLMVNEL